METNNFLQDLIKISNINDNIKIVFVESHFSSEEMDLEIDRNFDNAFLKAKERILRKQESKS